MANSNENTQNPKDNQEKMANEGIQEHSEHTAENKQPESKDNAQKKMNLHAYVNFLKRLRNGCAQAKIKTQIRQMKMPQKITMLQNRKK